MKLQLSLPIDARGGFAVDCVHGHPLVSAVGIDNMEPVVLNDYGAGRKSCTVFQNDGKQGLIAYRC